MSGKQKPQSGNQQSKGSKLFNIYERSTVVVESEPQVQADDPFLRIINLPVNQYVTRKVSKDLPNFSAFITFLEQKFKVSYSKGGTIVLSLMGSVDKISPKLLFCVKASHHETIFDYRNLSFSSQNPSVTANFSVPSQSKFQVYIALVPSDGKSSNKRAVKISDSSDQYNSSGGVVEFHETDSDSFPEKVSNQSKINKPNISPRNQQSNFFGLSPTQGYSWLNCYIQIFFHLKKIRSDFLGVDTPDCSLFELNKIFNQLKTKNASTARLIESLDFSENGEGDVTSMIEALFNVIRNDLEENMEILEVFNGFWQLHYVYEAGYREEQSKLFTEIVVDLDDGYDLDTLIKASFEPIEGSKKYRGTGVELDCLQHKKIKTAPDILTIRVEESEEDNSVNIKFRKDLDLSRYSVGSRVDAKYSLYAVMFHGPNTKNHYFVSINVNMSDQWYTFNDQKITNGMQEARGIVQPYVFIYVLKSRIKQFSRP